MELYSTQYNNISTIIKPQSPQYNRASVDHSFPQSVFKVLASRWTCLKVGIAYQEELPAPPGHSMRRVAAALLQQERPSSVASSNSLGVTTRATTVTGQYLSIIFRCFPVNVGVLCQKLEIGLRCKIRER